MFHEFNTRTGECGYTYRRNPLHARTFTILKRDDDDADFAPIGDYTVLDAAENPALSEKKVINLVTLLNGGDHVLELGADTRSRLLFYLVPHDGPPGHTKIIFYTLGDQGVSHENALLSLNERVGHEH